MNEKAFLRRKIGEVKGEAGNLDVLGVCMKWEEWMLELGSGKCFQARD